MSIWKPATDAHVDSMEYVINGLVLDNYDPAGGNRPPWDGVPVIVSANNQDTDAATTSPPRMAQGYIAGCEDRSPNPRLNNGYCSPGHVISVGATSNNVVRWDCLHAGGGEVCSSNDPGSNYGIRQTLLNGTTVVSGAVDIYAPGHDMIAASIANSIAYRITYRSGTSFAAPVVTGTVALLLQQQPTLKPTAVWDWLSQHATTFANTADPHFATVGGNLKFVQAPTCPNRRKPCP